MDSIRLRTKSKHLGKHNAAVIKFLQSEHLKFKHATFNRQAMMTALQRDREEFPSRVEMGEDLLTQSSAKNLKELIRQFQTQCISTGYEQQCGVGSGTIRELGRAKRLEMRAQAAAHDAKVIGLLAIISALDRQNTIDKNESIVFESCEVPAVGLETVTQSAYFVEFVSEYLLLGIIRFEPAMIRLVRSFRQAGGGDTESTLRTCNNVERWMTVCRDQSINAHAKKYNFDQIFGEPPEDSRVDFERLFNMRDSTFETIKELSKKEVGVLSKPAHRRVGLLLASPYVKAEELWRNNAIARFALEKEIPLPSTLNSCNPLNPTRNQKRVVRNFLSHKKERDEDLEQSHHQAESILSCMDSCAVEMILREAGIISSEKTKIWDYNLSSFLIHTTRKHPTVLAKIIRRCPDLKSLHDTTKVHLECKNSTTSLLPVIAKRLKELWKSNEIVLSQSIMTLIFKTMVLSDCIDQTSGGNILSTLYCIEGPTSYTDLRSIMIVLEDECWHQDVRLFTQFEHAKRVVEILVNPQLVVAGDSNAMERKKSVYDFADNLKTQADSRALKEALREKYGENHLMLAEHVFDLCKCSTDYGPLVMTLLCEGLDLDPEALFILGSEKSEIGSLPQISAQLMRDCREEIRAMAISKLLKTGDVSVIAGKVMKFGSSDSDLGTVELAELDTLYRGFITVQQALTDQSGGTEHLLEPHHFWNEYGFQTELAKLDLPWDHPTYSADIYRILPSFCLRSNMDCLQMGISAMENIPASRICEAIESRLTLLSTMHGGNLVGRRGFGFGCPVLEQQRKAQSADVAYKKGLVLRQVASLVMRLMEGVSEGPGFFAKHIALWKSLYLTPWCTDDTLQLGREGGKKVWAQFSDWIVQLSVCPRDEHTEGWEVICEEDDRVLQLMLVGKGDARALNSILRSINSDEAACTALLRSLETKAKENFGRLSDVKDTMNSQYLLGTIVQSLRQSPRDPCIPMDATALRVQLITFFVSSAGLKLLMSNRMWWDGILALLPEEDCIPPLPLDTEETRSRFTANTEACLPVDEPFLDTMIRVLEHLECGELDVRLQQMCKSASTPRVAYTLLSKCMRRDEKSKLSTSKHLNAAIAKCLGMMQDESKLLEHCLDAVGGRIAPLMAAIREVENNPQVLEKIADKMMADNKLHNDVVPYVVRSIFQCNGGEATTACTLFNAYVDRLQNSSVTEDELYTRMDTLIRQTWLCFNQTVSFCRRSTSSMKRVLDLIAQGTSATPRRNASKEYLVRFIDGVLAKNTTVGPDLGPDLYDDFDYVVHHVLPLLKQEGLNDRIALHLHHTIGKYLHTHLSTMGNRDNGLHADACRNLEQTSHSLIDLLNQTQEIHAENNNQIVRDVMQWQRHVIYGLSESESIDKIILTLDMYDRVIASKLLCHTVYEYPFMYDTLLGMLRHGAFADTSLLKARQDLLQSVTNGLASQLETYPEREEDISKKIYAINFSSLHNQSNVVNDISVEDQLERVLRFPMVVCKVMRSHHWMRMPTTWLKGGLSEDAVGAVAAMYEDTIQEAGSVRNVVMMYTIRWCVEDWRRTSRKSGRTDEEETATKVISGFVNDIGIGISR